MDINSKINKDLILREKLALQRTDLANQTTLLAFLRTSMYFLMAGLTLQNIFKSHLWIEVIFYIISGSMLLAGVINFFLHKKMIRKSEIHIGDFKTEYLEKK
ncbi:MAG: DUF202 domain-containing protein [Saprospiraceae bacterium]|jgi:putative membrane protein|nr:DUF202 domain-containing protein [Saprospiraceae bacterium]